MIPVINGIEAPVKSLTVSADSPIVVIEGGVGERIESRNARIKEGLNDDIARGQRFKRKGVWGSGVSGYSRTALWTESASPLPRPPLGEFSNLDALQTIHDHPALFEVSTPIKIDTFESLLVDHPNQPFVRLVCTGLREGFWPFADTHPLEWPRTHDNSDRPPKTVKDLQLS
jgi:hypothetical protein